ncbi:thioredoxin-dependent thiol peroxidase [Pseudaeromonas sp. ZJS20]|uniref:thioredoxin-dependent thiol peroxidase n=1 Tax=Pseudaeromonas aegiceratis TaxID=3153928 RepID=UPI00390C6DC0
MPILSAGIPAPDFTLPDQNGNPVQLSALRGRKVLIYFYPKAMTPGCTTQACSLRDVQAELAAHQLVVLGISPDAPARLKKFEARDELNFTLLGDEDHRVADAYGVWGPKKFMGKEFDGIHRISFLVDEAGTLIKVFDKFKTSDHHQVVLDYLASLAG